jgi:hypothetical protein
MSTIGELASVVRSKNAGALYYTLDVMFADEASYNKVIASKVLNETRISELYQLSANAVQVINYDVAYAIKITIPRDYPSGDPACNDVYGAQQHAPLLGIEVPD